MDVPNLPINEIVWNYSFTIDKMLYFETMSTSPLTVKCLIGGISCELPVTVHGVLRDLDVEYIVPKPINNSESVSIDVAAGLKFTQLEK